jgi:hypothetical protein
MPQVNVLHSFHIQFSLSILYDSLGRSLKQKSTPRRRRRRRQERQRGRGSYRSRRREKRKRDRNSSVGFFSLLSSYDYHLGYCDIFFFTFYC